MATRQKTIRHILAGATRITQSEQDFDSVQIYDATGATWYDETTDAASATTADVTLYGAVDSCIYYGDADKFSGWTELYSTSISGGTVAIEYWNGSTWAAITSATAYINSSGTSSQVTFIPPSDWSTTTVNGVSGLYWFRKRVAAVRTTAGVMSYARKIGYRTISKTIELDSATGRTFRSVRANVVYSSVVGGVVSGFSVAPYFISKVGSGSESTKTVNNQSALITGAYAPRLGTEQSGASYTIDLTSQFSSDFTGTSHTVVLSFPDYTVNPCIGDVAWYMAELIATYDYDDTQSTPIKTVIIPFENEVNALTTALQTIDSVTKLTGTGGFIEEASPTIKSAYFILTKNRNEGSTTNASLFVALNSESETEFAFNMANQSSNGDYFYLLWDRSADIPTTTTLDFKARVSDATALRPKRLNALLVVTYTYDNASTTRENMSVWVPMTRSSHLVRHESDATVGTEHPLTFWVVEDNPTLKESAVIMYLTSANSLSFGIGNTDTSYTQEIPFYSDANRHILRFDSGASVLTSNGFSLAAGKNTLKIRSRASSNSSSLNSSFGFSAAMLLNYSFDKSSAAKSSFCTVLAVDSLLNPTKSYGIPDNSSATSASSSSSVFGAKNTAIFNLPASDYFVNQLGTSCTAALVPTSIMKMASILEIRTPSSPYTLLAQSTRILQAQTDGYSGFSMWRYETTWDNSYKLTPNDPGPSWDIEAAVSTIFSFSDTASVVNGNSGTVDVEFALWYADQPYTISGTVTGYSGDGSGITVKLHSHQYGGRVVAETTTAVGGTYSFKWHDNTTDDLFVETDAGTKVGRSQNFTAS